MFPSLTLAPADPGDKTYFGWAIAVADFDGDRYADLAVGSSGAAMGAGQVFIYRGGPSGPPSLPSASLSAPQTGRVGFGSNLAAAGDVNGDGYADLFVKDNGATGLYTAPTAYVIYGGPQGLSSSGATLIPQLDYSYLVTTNWGQALAGIGDVDGDGYDDLALSAPAVESDTGEVFVFHGGALGASPTYTRLLLSPIVWNEEFGETLAGMDVDGDGFSDLVVGTPRHSVTTVYGPEPEGRVYVYPGSTNGVAGLPSGYVDQPGGSQLFFGIALGRVQ
jgi:hypothetical protein